MAAVTTPLATVCGSLHQQEQEEQEQEEREEQEQEPEQKEQQLENEQQQDNTLCPNKWPTCTHGGERPVS